MKSKNAGPVVVVAKKIKIVELKIKIMNPIKRKQLQKEMKRSINRYYAFSFIVFCIILPVLMNYLVSFFMSKNLKVEDFKFYTNAIICLLFIAVVLRFWPRKFDDRELELYDKYLTNKKNLKIEIKKEKIEKDYKENIKKLEEENSYKPAEHDTM